MRLAIGLIFSAMAFAQYPQPGGSAGGGGGGTGASNPSCTFAGSATTCTIDTTSLAVPSANYTQILVQCFTGASTTQTPVTITTYVYTNGSGNVASVAPHFSAAAAAGYCVANATGTGPTGSPGANAPVLTVPITTNLATTVAGNPSNATIIPAYNYNETLTSTVTMSGTNLTLQCVKGTTFTKGSNNPILSITGTNITIDGCTFDGAEAGGFTGNVINISVSSGVTIKNSTFKNVAAAANAINGQAAGTQTGLTIGPGNTFSNVLGSAFYGDGTAISGLNIHDNVMDCSQISSGANSCIASHTSVSGQTNKNTKIANNQIIQGAGCYAIEVGSFTAGAVPPDTVSITGNKVQRTANAACGGISVSTATNVTESLNTVDNGGFTYVTNVFEFVGTFGSSFTGNVSSNEPVGANNFDLSISGTSGATVQSNIFQGGIFLGNGSGTTNLHNDSNVVEGNTITLPSGATYDSTHPLIWLRCNAAGGCTVNNNRVMGNAVTMTGATVQYGIYLDNDFPGGGGGSVDSNNISSNGFIGTFGTARFGSGGSPTNTTDDGFVTVTGNGIANFTVDTTAHITASTPITDALALSNNATLGQNLYFYRAGTGWVQQLNSGGGGITYPAGTGFAIVTGGAAWGTTLADPLPAGHGGSGVANTATHTLGTSNQNWATLGTGIVKNTTTTGAISDAAAADVYGLFSSCTGSSGLFLKDGGTCAAPSGSGTVTVVGAGSLTSTALVTGGGTTTLQTPSATATMDSSGNVSTPGYLLSGVGSGLAGVDALSQGTAPTFGASAGQIPTTGYVGWIGPASGVTTSYGLQAPVAAPSGGQIMSCPTPTSSLSQCTWVSPSGSGTVTSFSAGTLSPLFTTSVATSTTTPALSFSLSTATAHTFLGNNTGSTAAPGYQSIGLADLPTFHGSCTEVWGGSGTSFALTSGDDSIVINACYNDTGATRTITAVKCTSDNGSNTTTVNPTFGASGTGTTILSGALTCGNSNAMSSTGTVSNASWTTGSGIAPAMSGTLTGTHIVMIVEYSYAPF